MKKRTLLLVSLIACLCHLSGVSSDETAKVIKISAKKFAFSPRNITLKKDKAVILQLTTLDQMHGFSIPALDLRADIQPGRVTELKITPKNTGDMHFYCDIFCGSGHDDMNGKITVVD